jgi:hypothetical protein
VAGIVHHCHCEPKAWQSVSPYRSFSKRERTLTWGFATLGATVVFVTISVISYLLLVCCLWKMVN